MAGSSGGGSELPVGDARLAEIVRRHFDFHLVSHADADEMFSHLAGDMGKDFMAIRQRDPEHGSRQDLCHGTCQFNGLFLRHARYF